MYWLGTRVLTKAAAPFILFFTFASIYVSRLRQTLNILREKLKREENSFHKCWKATARTKLPLYSEKELVD